MLKFPRFDTTEFNCLSKDLTAVGLYLDAVAFESRLKAAKEELKALTKRHGAYGADLLRAVLNQMQKACEPTDSNKAVARTQSICNSMRRTFNSSLPTSHRDRLLQEQARQLLPLFSRPDEKLFQQVFELAFPEEIGKDVKEECSRLRRRISKLESQIERLWRSSPKCFGGGVPEKFRASRLNHGVDESGMAQIIIRTFVDVWRHRAGMFAEPVSVYGTALRSMVGEQKLNWMLAYEALGFREIPKKPYYAAIKAQRADEQSEEFMAQPIHVEVSEEPVDEEESAE